MTREEARANYRIMSAMRGPDMQDPLALNLKLLITARLRSLAYSESECLGHYVSALLLHGDLAVARQSLEALGLEHYHYVCHLHEAVRVTRGHTVWGWYGNTLCRALDQCRSRLYGAILNKEAAHATDSR